LATPAISPPETVAVPPPWLYVLLAGLLAGAFDLTFAFTFYGAQGASPERVLRSIAAGLAGREGALAPGLGPVALGAFLHFFISVCAAFIFYFLSRRVPVLTRRWLLAGAAFGVAMYLAMHFIVVPLSRLPFRLPTLHNVVGELGSHIFLFGMVIAYGVSRAHAAELRRGGHGT